MSGSSMRRKTLLTTRQEQDMGDEDIEKIIFGDTKQSGFWASISKYPSSKLTSSIVSLPFSSRGSYEARSVGIRPCATRLPPPTDGWEVVNSSRR